MAERRAAIGTFYNTNADDMDPVVRKIVAGADNFTAVDAFAGTYRLQDLRAQTQPVWQQIEVMALPTTGTIYTVEQIRKDPIALNTNLGYYTNFMNLLDLAGLALPAGFPSQRPSFWYYTRRPGFF